MNIVARMIQGINLLAMSVRILISDPVLLLVPLFIACLTRMVTIIMLLFRISPEMQYILHFCLFSYCAYLLYAYVIYYRVHTASSSPASHQESIVALINRIRPLLFFASINLIVTGGIPLLLLGPAKDVWTLVVIGWSICTLALIPLLYEYDLYTVLVYGPRVLLELIPNTLAIAGKIWPEAFCATVIFQSMYWLLGRIDYTVFGSYAVIAGMLVIYLCYILAILDGIFTAMVYHHAIGKR